MSSISAVGQSFGSFHRVERAPRVTSSLTAESPTIQKLQNILGVDIGILATQGMRARKTRKCHEMHAYGLHAYEIHAIRYTLLRYMPVRCTPARRTSPRSSLPVNVYEVYGNFGLLPTVL